MKDFKQTGISASIASALAILTVSGFAGCQSYSPSQYVSPRVTGRVLDAQSREPLKNVQVQRASSGRDVTVGEAPKAGQVMEKPTPITTRSDGTFVLNSVQDLVLFRKTHWSSVKVSFECGGYQWMVTNFSAANANQTASGEPVVNSGDILLNPVAK